MYTIGREGQGVTTSVHIDDVEVYQALRDVVAAQLPSALKLVGLGKFTSPEPPVLWALYKALRDTCEERQGQDESKEQTRGSNLYHGRKPTAWPPAPVDKLGRAPWEHQTEAVQRFHTRGGNFLVAPVGMGKTYIIASFFKRLLAQGTMPPYAIYTLPASAMQSVATELLAFGFRVTVVKATKGGKITAPKGTRLLELYGSTVRLPRHRILLMEHDTLRRMKPRLTALAMQYVFVCDEVHKAMNATQRTSVCLQLARLSKVFVVMTGTPIVDSKAEKLLQWLQLIVPYPVNKTNFWAAAAVMVSFNISTGVRVDRHSVVATQRTASEREEWMALVPVRLGGLRQLDAGNHEFMSAMKLDRAVCTRRMVKLTLEQVAGGRRVMLVAKDRAHQQQLRVALCKRGMPDGRIVVQERGTPLHMVEEPGGKNAAKLPHVAIVHSKHAEGYTLTAMTVMVTSVYPSSQATRTQLEGRMNRIGQRAKVITFYQVHCGILSAIREHHLEAASLERALAALGTATTLGGRGKK